MASTSAAVATPTSSTSSGSEARQPSAVVLSTVIAEAARDGVLGEAQRLEIAQRLAARLPS